MISKLETDKCLYQYEAVYHIGMHFGDKYVYYNDGGNLAIAKTVLNAFNEASGNDVVWSRSEKCWRYREKSDEPGRRQN